MTGYSHKNNFEITQMEKYTQPYGTLRMAAGGGGAKAAVVNGLSIPGTQAKSTYGLCHHHCKSSKNSQVLSPGNPCPCFSRCLTNSLSKVTLTLSRKSCTFVPYFEKSWYIALEDIRSLKMMPFTVFLSTSKLKHLRSITLTTWVEKINFLFISVNHV